MLGDVIFQDRLQVTRSIDTDEIAFGYFFGLHWFNFMHNDMPYKNSSHLHQDAMDISHEINF